MYTSRFEEGFEQVTGSWGEAVVIDEDSRRVLYIGNENRESQHFSISFFGDGLARSHSSPYVRWGVVIRQTISLFVISIPYSRSEMVFIKAMVWP